MPVDATQGRWFICYQTICRAWVEETAGKVPPMDITSDLNRYRSLTSFCHTVSSPIGKYLPENHLPWSVAVQPTQLGVAMAGANKLTSPAIRMCHRTI